MNTMPFNDCILEARKRVLVATALASLDACLDNLTLVNARHVCAVLMAQLRTAMPGHSARLLSAALSAYEHQRVMEAKVEETGEALSRRGFTSSAEIEAEMSQRRDNVITLHPRSEFPRGPSPSKPPAA